MPARLHCRNAKKYQVFPEGAEGVSGGGSRWGYSRVSDELSSAKVGGAPETPGTIGAPAQIPQGALGAPPSLALDSSSETRE